MHKTYRNSLCPICVRRMPAYDFAVRLRVYVCGWQPTRPSDLAEYLLIWHRKKRGRPIARDYTDLHEHTRAHARICWHVFCTLRNPKKAHAFRHTQTHSRWSRSFRHRDIGFRELISKYYELEKFGEESRALKREHISALCTTPGGLMFWRESKYFYPHAERSWRFFMLL